MGPRSLDRGEAVSPALAAVIGRASMGPRSLDRGEADLSRGAAVGRTASMGPRSLDRREGLRLLKADRLREASMGPRSLDRGEAERDVPPHRSLALQWGRGLWTAERVAVALGWLADEPLQWGRGLWTAERVVHRLARRPEVLASMGPRSLDRGETRRAGNPPTGHWGFNGAAVFGPRRGGPYSWPPSPRPCASMGPRSLDRGEAVETCVLGQLNRASMGPRSLDRGERRQ